MIVKRLHELSDLEAVSLFLGAEVQPETPSETSQWVCAKARDERRWDVDTVRHMAERDRTGNLGIWVALTEKPVAFCYVMYQDDGDRYLFLFLVSSDYPLEKQYEIADAIAFRSVSDMLADDHPAKRNFYGWFPADSWSGRYAKRCGFTSELVGKLTTPDPNPLLLWTIDMRKLLENVKHG